MSIKPYNQTDYTHITDIDQFFTYDAKNKEMVFNSISLKVYIPQRYSVFNLLTISDTVTTLAVVDLIIDDKFQAGLLMLTTIEMEADEVSTIMVGDLQYVVAILSQGCRFICNTERIVDSSILYAIWMEFITRGHLIYTIDYPTLSGLFDQSKSMCDSNMGVDHVLFEVIYSHLSRNPDNLMQQYRYTDMKQDFAFINLRSVGYATTSTTSRLLGSYFFQALNSSLIQTTTVHSDVEDLLRS